MVEEEVEVEEEVWRCRVKEEIEVEEEEEVGRCGVEEVGRRNVEVSVEV